LVEHNAGAHPNRAFVDVEVFDLAIVPREIDNESFADRIPHQTCAGAPRSDRDVFVRCGLNYRARLFWAGRECDAERLNLIDRSVGGVEVAGKVIEMNVAARPADPLFRTFTDHSADNLTQQRTGERHWQVNCYQFGPAVSITLKSKIRYNGKEYSSPAELPADVRMAYEKALNEGTVKKKFVVNGDRFASENVMPADLRKLCDDLMSVIENNGEVTIPSGKNPKRLLTKREFAIAVAVGAGIATLVLVRIVHG
jgi:hypothetical protein